MTFYGIFGIFQKSCRTECVNNCEKVFFSENFPKNGQFCFKSQFYDKMSEKKHHLGYFWGYDHLPESAVNTFSADHAYMREKGLK